MRFALALVPYNKKSGIRNGLSDFLAYVQTSTTLNLYTHAVQAANVKAVNVIADLLNGKAA